MKTRGRRGERPFREYIWSNTLWTVTSVTLIRRTHTRFDNDRNNNVTYRNRLGRSGVRLIQRSPTGPVLHEPGDIAISRPKILSTTHARRARRTAVHAWCGFRRIAGKMRVCRISAGLKIIKKKNHLITKTNAFHSGVRVRYCFTFLRHSVRRYVFPNVLQTRVRTQHYDYIVYRVIYRGRYRHVVLPDYFAIKSKLDTDGRKHDNDGDGRGIFRTFRLMRRKKKLVREKSTGSRRYGTSRNGYAIRGIAML